MHRPKVRLRTISQPAPALGSRSVTNRSATAPASWLRAFLSARRSCSSTASNPISLPTRAARGRKTPRSRVVASRRCHCRRRDRAQDRGSVREVSTGGRRGIVGSADRAARGRPSRRCASAAGRPRRGRGPATRRRAVSPAGSPGHSPGSGRPWCWSRRGSAGRRTAHRATPASSRLRHERPHPFRRGDAAGWPWAWPQCPVRSHRAPL